MSQSHDDHDHGPMHYVKLWGVLVVLFIISVIGPELGVRWVTLVTAFGIAIVKALIVAAYFMHLNIEKKYIHYMLYTMLVFVGIFFTGIMTDVMKPTGSNWINEGALHNIEINKHKLELPAEH